LPPGGRSCPRAFPGPRWLRPSHSLLLIRLSRDCYIGLGAGFPKYLPQMQHSRRFTAACCAGSCAESPKGLENTRLSTDGDPAFLAGLVIAHDRAAKDPDGFPCFSHQTWALYGNG